MSDPKYLDYGTPISFGGLDPEVIPSKTVTRRQWSVALEQKIALLRQTSATNSEAIGDRIRGKLSQIALCNQATQQRNDALDSAELLAAENRGIEQALAIFSTEEAAKENALAHLRALKISGNQ